jgi:hypothetical protein
MTPCFTRTLEERIYKEMQMYNRLKRDSTAFDRRALITGTGIGQNVDLISLCLTLFSYVYLFRIDEYNILSDSKDLRRQ